LGTGRKTSRTQCCISKLDSKFPVLMQTDFPINDGVEL